MREISSPVVDDIEVFRDIAIAKSHPNNSYLSYMQVDIEKAYQPYIDIAPIFEEITPVPLDVCQQEALKHADESETAPLKRIREQILGKAINARCPYCELGETSTLDHYLPKEKNPQFAVFTKNLIPCCGQCNTLKGTKLIKEDTGEREFFYPYFKELPPGVYLKVNIETKIPESALVIKFNIKKGVGMNLRIYNRLLSQFGLLKLSDRYSRMSLCELKEKHHSLRRIYGLHSRAEDVARELKRLAKETTDCHGINHYLSVLYGSLSDDAVFCDGGFEVLT